MTFYNIIITDYKALRNLVWWMSYNTYEESDMPEGIFVTLCGYLERMNRMLRPDYRIKLIISKNITDKEAEEMEDILINYQKHYSIALTIIEKMLYQLEAFQVGDEAKRKKRVLNREIYKKLIQFFGPIRRSAQVSSVDDQRNVAFALEDLYKKMSLIISRVETNMKK